jgi:gamma-glutamylcyclotransferase (GGCT)/AIG2-like uncharacterized protein YtfP
MLSGYKVCFNIPGTIFKNSVCNIVSDHSSKASEVWGVLYRVNKAEFVRRMDFYEGVAHGEYQRETIEVTQLNGEKVTAFTYLNSKHAEEASPSLVYLNIMLRGATQGRIPEDYVRKLERWKNQAT